MVLQKLLIAIFTNFRIYRLLKINKKHFIYFQIH